VSDSAQNLRQCQNRVGLSVKNDLLPQTVDIPTLSKFSNWLASPKLAGMKGGMGIGE